MYSGSDESICGIDGDGVDGDGVVVDSDGVGMGLVGNGGGVVSVEGDVAHDADGAEVVGVALEEEEAGEVVDGFHVGRIELEVVVGWIVGGTYVADDLTVFEMYGEACCEVVVAVVLIFANEVEIDGELEVVVEAEGGVGMDDEGLFAEVGVVTQYHGASS